MLLIAVGAILKYAVHVQNNNVNVNTVGMILLIVGIIGVVLSFVFWNSWGGFGNRGPNRDARLVRPVPLVEEVHDDRY